jgi:hypothetical protein
MAICGITIWVNRSGGFIRQFLPEDFIYPVIPVSGIMILSVQTG